MKQLAELFLALSQGRASKDEQEQVDAWKGESSQNARLYDEFLSDAFVERKLRFIEENNILDAYADFKSRANGTSRKVRRIRICLKKSEERL